MSVAKLLSQITILKGYLVVLNVFCKIAVKDPETSEGGGGGGGRGGKKHEILSAALSSHLFYNNFFQAGGGGGGGHAPVAPIAIA